MRYCVIMCGGVGSRFWPYSREDRPKQFIDFLGTGRSLLQMTYDRILPLVDAGRIIVVTNERYRSLVAEQLPALDHSQILCEPARRNTAPCIAWAMRHILARDPEASVVVTPSDHFITRETEFADCISRGFDFVETHDALLTLGIKPVRPETGYGYIQLGEPVKGAPGISRVKTFTEKPSRELAEVFIASGEFMWNSGIFLWRAAVANDALRTFAPDLTAVFDRGADVFARPEEERAFIEKEFSSCPSISIDYAMMEKAPNVYVETALFGWSDLGTWGSLYDNSPKNSDTNVTQGCTVMAYDSKGNIFATSNPEKLIVVKGLHDSIVADTGSVLLICPRSEEQTIKTMVEDVKQKTGGRYL